MQPEQLVVFVGMGVMFVGSMVLGLFWIEWKKIPIMTAMLESAKRAEKHWDEATLSGDELSRAHVLAIAGLSKERRHKAYIA